ncbi:MAG: RagB/SusD family nutrient uptake outer membrane protein, partial [Mucilaginibacter polytrichastri]|nr:RagB/SusD family nutrient uptake outer membrane protein [Mucilaginibacter polytrichastri]
MVMRYRYLHCSFLWSVFTLLVFVQIACKKAYLDVKPDKGLLVPATLSDFDALLDNLTVFNVGPEIQEIASDDFFTTDEGWTGLSPTEQLAYVFSAQVVQTDPSVAEWNQPYQQVFYANIVLDGLEKLPRDRPADYDRIRGTALFHRSFAFFNLLQLFAAPMLSSEAKASPGIPLRLEADVSKRSVRAGLEESYAQLIADLNAARDLLPVKPRFRSRPSRVAVDALLARVYLSMADYPRAREAADRSLSAFSGLYDFNTLDTASLSPFPQVLPDAGEEVIFYARLTGYSFEVSPLVFVDSILYDAYAENDLRRDMYFKENAEGRFNYFGTYEASSYFFGGLAADELYLIRAECLAREGEITGALSDLNTLLEKRWRRNTFQPLGAGSPGEALRLVLSERRKELVGRGLRWSDLRRLNTEAGFQKEVLHRVQGRTYRLEPGSKGFVYPIPAYEIAASGIEQN